MYVYWNAVKNLLQNKGRSFLIFIIMLMIIITASVAIIINTTTEKIVTDYASRFNVTASLKVDYMSLLSSSDAYGNLDIPDISYEQYRSFANSDYVKDYTSYGEFAAFVSDLKQVEVKNTSNAADGVIVDTNRDSMYYTANATVYGYSDITLLTDFIDGSRKIKEGRAFETDNECIISSELAELNHLSLGDTITVRPTIKSCDITIALKITGIYTDATDNSNAAASPTEATANRRNDILTTYDTLTQLGSDYFGTNVSFTLTGPEVVDDFSKEIKEKGLPSCYYVSATDDEYNEIVAPVKGLTKMANIFLAVVLILGSVILILLSLLTIRERKYEIGVLRAKGMKKAMVALQFLTEHFILITISLILGLGIGIVIAQPISNLLLTDQISIAQEQKNKRNSSIQNIFYASNLDETSFGDTSSHDPITEITISLTKEAVADIIVIAFLLSIISSITGLFFITKHEPMQILANRA